MAQSTQYFASSQLYDEVRGKLQDDGLLDSTAMNYLEIGHHLGFDEIDERSGTSLFFLKNNNNHKFTLLDRIVNMQKEKKLAVTSFVQLGFDLQSANFDSGLDEAVDLVRRLTGNTLSGFGEVITTFKRLGFDTMCKKTSQKFFAFGALIKGEHSVTVALINFRHQQKDTQAGFLGFDYKIVLKREDLLRQLIMD